jgi:hypothetical protein
MKQEQFQSTQNIQAKCLESRNSVTILIIIRCTETGTYKINGSRFVDLKV